MTGDLNVTRETLQLKCKEAITALILNGTFAPGERLVEARLANMLDLSRTTIRAALQALVQEGLLLQESYRGVVIRPLTAKGAHETATIREALEVLAVRRAAVNITPDECIILWKLFDRLLASTASADAAEVFQRDVAIHRYIVEIARHELLSIHYSMIEPQILFYIAHAGAPFMSRNDLERQHRPILEAICEQRPAEAEKALHAHFEEATSFLVHLLEEMDATKTNDADSTQEIRSPWSD